MVHIIPTPQVSSINILPNNMFELLVGSGCITADVIACTSEEIAFSFVSWQGKTPEDKMPDTVIQENIEA